MNVYFDFSNMFSGGTGNQDEPRKQTTPTFEQITQCSSEIQIAHRVVLDNLGKGWYGWTELPFRSEQQIAELDAYGKMVRARSDSYVVFGIGGSALGPLSVATALLHLRHNELAPSKRNAPRLYVEDNIDPERMNSLLDIIEPKNTDFVFITKSGETSETLSQFLTVFKLLKEQLGEDAARERIAVVTTMGKGTLFEIAKNEGFRIFDIETGVGGRFSVFSNVGLVPFAVMGFDIRAMLNGARTMTNACQNADIYKNPALMSAFLHVNAYSSGKNISVMMPYADSLKFMSDFYCQLWGESLGKMHDIYGTEVRCGQTPVKALGVTDQHSQIQLYVEGPRDKIVTIIAVDHFRNEIVIPHDKDVCHAEFLKGVTFGKLINSERIATTFALTKAGCANYTITLPEVTETTIAQLLMYFMYQTAYAGALLSIDAFNQPGVEEGKKATFAILGRAGYEEKLKEILERKAAQVIINVD